MSANFVALAYLTAAVLFILALKGLSSPISARRGNMFGMIGMAVDASAALGFDLPLQRMGGLEVKLLGEFEHGYGIPIILCVCRLRRQRGCAWQ